jgi:uncharacterized protein with von Willebrand factor type A (vWA) domain
VAAGFCAALHAAGMAVGPDRAERFSRAITIVRPAALRELYWCGLATLVSDPAQIETFAQVFAAVFGGLVDQAEQRGDPASGPLPALPPLGAKPGSAARLAAAGVDRPMDAGSRGQRAEREARRPLRAIATAAERLAGRDFAELTPDELPLLVWLMRELALVTPSRRTRRYRRRSAGHRTDLRSTLRRARRTGGEPLLLVRGARRTRSRRLVVLCDISGSMEPYARAMLQLLYCATGGARAEVFAFATRLTRLTATLTTADPAAALLRAGQAAPDWSGGTRIGAALKEFNDRYGCRGMARGAVVLIISDGWETGDPARVGVEMARLSRVAYRIVWANPRTQSPRYRAEVGGMAAAWPYCDAVVSAHRLTALAELLAALAEPARAARPRSGRRYRGDPDGGRPVPGQAGGAVAGSGGAAG